MFGSPYVKWVSGCYHHIGYMTTELIGIPAGLVLPKGTWFAQKQNDDTKAVYASGNAVGFTMQEIDNEGHTSLVAYKNRAIGKMDLPITVGQAISVRVPHLSSEMEFEGVGEAEPGNLVCTEGTGALTSGSAENLELSFLNGCIIEAQAGDVVMLHLRQANLVPEIDGNLRIRVRCVGNYIKGA